MLRHRIGFAALVALALGVLVSVVAIAGSGGSPTESADDQPQPQRPHHQRAHRRHTTPSGTPHRPTGPGRRIPDGAERARVTDHVDGDTVHLVGLRGTTVLPTREDTSVRLLEIDTPESVDPRSPDQCYAARASHALSVLLPIGATVWVTADRDLLDPYGRTLLYLWTARGRFVNLRMVQQGYARAVLFEPNDRYIAVMRRAERRARAAGLGLWGACEYFGQPLGLMGGGGQPPAGKPAGRPDTDPRFPFCSDANDAGYGDYVRGRDPEYAWYDDADGDGVVCER